VSFLVCIPALSQVTVFDAPNQVHFLATVDTLRAELAQVQSLVSAVSGIRQLKGSSINPLQMTQSVTGIQSLESPLQNSVGSGAGCVSRNAASLATCSLDAVKTSREQATAAQLFVQQSAQVGELGLIESDLAASADLKSSTDIGARAQLANATVGNERLTVEIFAFQAELQNEAIAKAYRADQLNRLMTPTRAVDSLSVLTFGAGE